MGTLCQSRGIPIYMYTCTHTHTCSCQADCHVHAYIHTYIHTHTCSCQADCHVHAYIHTYIHTYTFSCQADCHVHAGVYTDGWMSGCSRASWGNTLCRTLDIPNKPPVYVRTYKSEAVCQGFMNEIIRVSSVGVRALRYMCAS
jgi:hypothetical protein